MDTGFIQPFVLLTFCSAVIAFVAVVFIAWAVNHDEPWWMFPTMICMAVAPYLLWLIGLQMKTEPYILRVAFRVIQVAMIIVFIWIKTRRVPVSDPKGNGAGA